MYPLRLTWPAPPPSGAARHPAAFSAFASLLGGHHPGAGDEDAAGLLLLAAVLRGDELLHAERVAGGGAGPMYTGEREVGKLNNSKQKERKKLY